MTTEFSVTEFLPGIGERYSTQPLNGTCAHCGDVMGNGYVTLRFLGTIPHSFAICESCQPDVIDAISDQLAACQDCECPIFGEGDLVDIGEDGFGASVDLSAMRVSLIIVRDANGDITYSTYPAQYEYIGGGRYVCYSCRDEYIRCGNCSSIVHVDDSTSCEYCGESNCDDCGNCCGDDECGDYCDCGECGRSNSDFWSAYNLLSTYIDNARANTMRGKVIRSTRPFGVELETSGGSCASEMFAAYGEAIILEAKDEHCGNEFVTLPNSGLPGESALRDALGILRRAEYRPNSECGTHFHVDMHDMGTAAILRTIGTLAMVEPMIYAFTNHRENSSWARNFATQYAGLTPADCFRQARGYDGTNSEFDPYRWQQFGRYAAINSHAIKAHGTLEIRALDGTDNAERIIHAIAFVTGMVDWSVDYGASIGEIAASGGRNAAWSVIRHAARNGYFTADTLEYLRRRVDAGYGPDELRDDDLPFASWPSPVRPRDSYRW